MSDIARVNTILGKRLCAIGIVGYQLVAVEMKIAYERHMAIHIIESCADGWYRFRSRSGIYGNTHQFRTCARKLGHLHRGSNFIFRIGIGHRLDYHRRATANYDRTYIDADTVSARRKNTL